MSGIKETRKKLQRTVLSIVSCEKAESALHELTLLKQTVDSQVELLSAKLNTLEECDDAADTEEKVHQGNYPVNESEVFKAAKEGFNTIYG